MFAVGLFLRKKEDDIRISIQELSQQEYNEDDVIAELQTMIGDVSRTRQPIPQVVELQQLAVLNRDAQDRGGALNMVTQERTRPHLPSPGDGGVAPHPQTFRVSQEAPLSYPLEDRGKPMPHPPGGRGGALQQDGLVYRNSQEQPHPPGGGMAYQRGGLVHRASQEQRVSRGEKGPLPPQLNSLYSTADGYGGSSTLV